MLSTRTVNNHLFSHLDIKSSSLQKDYIEKDKKKSPRNGTATKIEIFPRK